MDEVLGQIPPTPLSYLTTPSSAFVDFNGHAFIDHPLKDAARELRHSYCFLNSTHSSWLKPGSTLPSMQLNHRSEIQVCLELPASSRGLEKGKSDNLASFFTLTDFSHFQICSLQLQPITIEAIYQISFSSLWSCKRLYITCCSLPQAL